MRDTEYGKCQVCGEESLLERTYFRYPLQCECHNPQHIELICHCKDCVPKEPEYTKVAFKTEDLKNPIAIALKVLTTALAKDKGPGSYYYGWQSNIACTIMG